MTTRNTRIRTYKIETLQNVPFASSVMLADNRLTTASHQTLTFPTEGGTVLTSLTMNNVATNVDRLVDYLEGWALAGNITMSDIKQYVNTNENDFQITCIGFNDDPDTHERAISVRVDKVRTDCVYNSFIIFSNDINNPVEANVIVNDDNTIIATFVPQENTRYWYAVVYTNAQNERVYVVFNPTVNAVTAKNATLPVLSAENGYHITCTDVVTDNEAHTQTVTLHFDNVRSGFVYNGYALQNMEGVVINATDVTQTPKALTFTYNTEANGNVEHCILTFSDFNLSGVIQSDEVDFDGIEKDKVVTLPVDTADPTGNGGN